MLLQTHTFTRISENLHHCGHEFTSKLAENDHIYDTELNNSKFNSLVSNSLQFFRMTCIKQRRQYEPAKNY